MRNGPTKIILINAGKYDYAEVLLDGAIQIVGDNNWGKTTLINTLQFLYFDEKSKFGLGTYAPDETLEYYFANEHSYVLFECRTLRGQAIIGWRGASKTSGGDPERFSYLGPFQREDFFDGDHLRKPKEISAILGSERGFQLLAKASDHRTILLSGAGQRHAGLGIVALNDGERFSDFRETFRNLLNLANIRQEQMRERLLMLAGLPTDYVAIDARRVGGKDYEDLKRDTDELKEFKLRQEDARKVIKLFHERQIVWGQLNYRWEDLKVRKKRFDQNHSVQIEGLTGKITKAGEDVTKAKETLVSKREKKEELIKQKSPIDVEIEKLDAGKKLHSAFAEQLEQAALENIERQLNNLLNRQQEASTETPESVRVHLEAAENRVCTLTKSIQHFSRLTITALREHFSEDQISQLFRLLNPDLLGLVTGRGGVSVTNPKGIVARLREIVSKINEGTYQDDLITVRFAPPDNVMAKFENIEALEKELARETKEVNRLKALLEAVTERDAVTTKIEGLKVKKQQQSDNLSAYRQHVQNLAKETEWRDLIKNLNQEIDALKKEINDLDKAFDDHKETLSTLKKEKESAENQHKAVLKRYEECQGKHALFNAAPRPDAEIPDDFDSAVSCYLHEYERQGRLTREFESEFSGLGVFADQYKQDDDAKTISALEQELDALPKREEAVQLRWNSHIQGLKGRFQEVLNDLRLVESAKTKLNREFKRVQVSDLKAVELTVDLQRDEISLIERLASMNELNLLNDATPIEKIFERAKAKIGANPITRITELFTLGVTVTRADGTIRKHPDIHQVESDGTTVTVKVLFNLLVLKSLLHKDDVAVPFFLDEIERLSSANQRAIIQMAKKLGFIAITAAPSAVSEVDVCYFLEPDERGRVVLTNAQRLALNAKNDYTHSA